MKSIILAGGSGTRLWPLSRELYPKQFLKIYETSLFQDTFIRCLEISD
ncbi:MAG: mannose-1-phosphate guanylyltransferase/mannose-6-phosphate isomerase, partial [Methanosarcinales archaeon]|nr:mannose-1-phosphate guanylyltransferase/mannose-6-phosphate isomerase [Methanosarcinales archaeon]